MGALLVDPVEPLVQQSLAADMIAWRCDSAFNGRFKVKWPRSM